MSFLSDLKAAEQRRQPAQAIPKAPPDNQATIFRRGATTIEDCRPCGKKTFGVVSLAKGLVGGAADRATQTFRATICEKCHAEDSTGARLFRIVNGTTYCGRPRLQHIYRDEVAEGCGCQIEFKTGRAEAACPRGRWGAVSKSG